jgi:acetyltransferase-like isoleucine patch superfamily enzyme
MINRLKKHVFKDAFLLYSYLSNLLFLILDILPHFVRHPLFWLFLSKLGKNPIIDYKVYFRYFKGIEIGDHVSINRGCEFFTSSSLDAKIRIGNHVAIAPNVKFYAAGHDYSDISLPDTAADITVGNHCWIGANSIILHGADIKEGAVIAAGSVVTGIIPPFSVAAGIPARVIKKRDCSSA